MITLASSESDIFFTRRNMEKSNWALHSSDSLLVCFVALGESQLVCLKARLKIKKNIPNKASAVILPVSTRWDSRAKRPRLQVRYCCALDRTESRWRPGGCLPVSHCAAPLVCLFKLEHGVTVRSSSVPPAHRKRDTRLQFDPVCLGTGRSARSQALTAKAASIDRRNWD